MTVENSKEKLGLPRVAFYISGLENKILIIENSFIVFQNIAPNKIYTLLYAFEPIVEAFLPL